MHRRQHHALVQRQQQLLLRSAELRHTLTRQAQALQSPLAVADQLRTGMHWLRQHPVWPLAAMALLAFRRPRHVLRWLPRLLGAWQIYRQLREGWARSAPPKA